VFFIGIIQLVIQVVELMKEGSFLAVNSNLSQLIHDGLDLIIEPAKKLPLVGDALQTALETNLEASSTNQEDIVELWKAQQDLVLANVDQLKRPKTREYRTLFGWDEDDAKAADALFETMDAIRQTDNNSIRRGNPSRIMKVKDDLEQAYAELVPYLNKSDI